MKRETIRAVIGLLAVPALALTLGTGHAQAGKYNEEVDKVELVEPEEGKALVYVVRPTKAAFSIYFWSFADDQFLGLTRGKGYAYKQMDPGTYTVWTKAENVAAIDVELEAGNTYYFRQKVLPGFGKARARTELLDEKDGKKALERVKKLSRPTEKGLEKARELAEKHLELAREKAAKDD